MKRTIKRFVIGDTKNSLYWVSGKEIPTFTASIDSASVMSEKRAKEDYDNHNLIIEAMKLDGYDITVTPVDVTFDLKKK